MSSQSMSGKANYNTDPNHLYYDLQLLNNDTVGAGEILPVRFTETRTSTILANPSEYFLSIQRFSLDTPSLPVFLPEVETRADLNPTNDPNLLVYKMAVYQWGSANAPTTANVRYSNQYDVTVRVPTPPFTSETLSDSYYFVYQYRDFIDMLNATLQKLCATTNINVPPPFIDINTSNLISVYFPQYTTADSTGPSGPVAGTIDNLWDDDPSASNKYVLCFNSALWALVNSLQTRYINSLNQIQATSPTTGQIPAFPLMTDPTATAGWYVVKVNPVASPIAFPAPVATVYNCNQTGGFPAFGNHYLQVDANTFQFLSLLYTSSNVRSFSVNTTPYSPCPVWNCVRTLIFTTALMPITNELVATPLILNSNPLLDNDDANNNFSPIITDLEVPLTRGDETKPTITYSPQAEYRLIDLQSNAPINGIEISIFWKDQYGYQHQFVLEPGCNASIKILFRKKIYNLSKLTEYTEPPRSNI
jgi:hypothetical protein